MHALYHTCTHTNIIYEYIWYNMWPRAMCGEFTAKLKPRPVLPPKITEVDTFSVEASPDSPEAKVSQGAKRAPGSDPLVRWSSVSGLDHCDSFGSSLQLSPFNKSKDRLWFPVHWWNQNETPGFLARSRGDAFLHQLLFHGEQGLPIGPKDS